MERLVAIAIILGVGLTLGWLGTLLRNEVVISRQLLEHLVGPGLMVLPITVGAYGALGILQYVSNERPIYDWAVRVGLPRHTVGWALAPLVWLLGVFVTELFGAALVAIGFPIIFAYTWALDGSLLGLFLAVCAGVAISHVETNSIRLVFRIVMLVVLGLGIRTAIPFRWGYRFGTVFAVVILVILLIGQKIIISCISYSSRTVKRVSPTTVRATLKWTVLSGYRKAVILFYRNRELNLATIPGVGTLAALLILLSKAPHISVLTSAIPYVLFSITTSHNVTKKFWHMELPLFSAWRWTSFPMRQVMGALLVVWAYVYLAMSTVFVILRLILPPLGQLVHVAQILSLGVTATGMGLATGALAFGLGLRRKSGDTVFTDSIGSPAFQLPLLVAILLTVGNSTLGLELGVPIFIAIGNGVVALVGIVIARSIIQQKLHRMIYFNEMS